MPLEYTHPPHKGKLFLALLSVPVGETDNRMWDVGKQPIGYGFPVRYPDISSPNADLLWIHQIPTYLCIVSIPTEVLSSELLFCPII